MSSRPSSSSKRPGGGGSSYYPTQWSEWTWNGQTRRHERYRLKTAEEYEFDYGPIQAEDIPRAYPPLGLIAQPLQQTPHPSQVSYTTTLSSDLDVVTRNLAQTTLGSLPSSNFISTRNPYTTTEEFDPHYKLHGAWEFRWGRVFKILWSEPRGNDTHGSTGGNSSNATFSERPGNQGEGPRHEKVRRFVIINAMEGHCICLPIMTYGGQGVNKRGVHARHHTIIHTGKPIAFRGEKEKGLTKKPIRVEPAGPRHKLDSASRLDYAKPYTVEYNVKVWFIGKIHSNSEWQLGTDYNRVNPPLSTRGSPPEDAFDDGSTYQSNYFPNPAYSTESLYPGAPAHSVSLSSLETSPNSYSMGPVSGAGAGFSSYLSQESLYPVDEFDSGDPGPSKVYESSHPQGYRESEELFEPMLEDSVESTTKNADSEIFDDNLSEDTTPFDSTSFEAQSLDIAGNEHTSTRSPSSIASRRTSRVSSLALTQTSMTADQLLIGDQLTNLLRQDAELRAMFKLAVQKQTWGSFEKNLRHCLIQLSKDLRSEIQSRESTQAAKAIRTFARNTAQGIKRTLELHELTIQTSQRMAEVYPLFNPRQSESSQMDIDSDESEDDEMDPVDDLEENTEEFEQLELLIVSSKSFEMFKKRFDLYANPVQARFAVFKQWPTIISLSSQHQISYDIEWDLKTFVNNHVKDPTRIVELITLTGDSKDAQALSSGEYLSHTWPRVGPFLLQGLEQLLISESRVCTENEVAKLEFIRREGFSDLSSGVCVLCTADYATHTEIAFTLSWMCASFRCSPHDDIMMSSTIIESNDLLSAKIGIAIRQNVLCRPLAEACWHPLFPRRVVAHDFPISSRQQGLGLEISFENMVAASRCLSFVEYENGLIAHGLTKILIPMSELEQDDAIQWHLEEKQKQNRYKLARISQVLSSFPMLLKWHKELQPEKLTQRRCFLGLAEHANVVIGTKDYQRTFSWSGTDKSPAETYVKSRSFTFSSGFVGFFTGTGTYTRTSTSIKTTICCPQDKDIFEILDSGREHLALFYDAAKNTGWHLPQISVALQMTHAIIAMHGYRVLEGGLEDPQDNFPGFANAGPDAATEASNAVKRSLRLKIRKYESKDSGPVVTDFAEMFEKVWHSLSDVETGLESAEVDFRKAHHIAPKFIHGVEFRDVANMETSIRIKTVKVSQPWAHLTSEQPLVIFSRNIQPPIVPESSSLCKTWRLVPPNQNYLVSMGLAVSSFLERRNEGLADGLDWNFRPELVQSHKPSKSEPVNHAQKLVSKRRPRPNSPIRRMLLNYRNGCFVFGPDTENECKESIHHREVTSEALASDAVSMTMINAIPDLATRVDSSIKTAGGTRNPRRDGNSPASISQLEMAAGISRFSEKNAKVEATPDIQNSAEIKMKSVPCKEDLPLYIVSGTTQPTDLAPRSLNGPNQDKSKPRVTALHNFFSDTQEKVVGRGLPKRTDARKFFDGPADSGHELDDLYDA